MLFPDLLKLQGLKIALMDETGSEMLQPVGKLKTDIKASPHISSAADMGTEWSCLFKVDLHLKSEFLLVGSLPLKPITEFLFFFLGGDASIDYLYWYPLPLPHSLPRQG